MKRLIVLSVALLLALCAGCSGETAKPKPTAALSEEASYVTAFGQVRCAESLTLSLPVESRFVEAYAREGQAMEPGTPVLKIDMTRLQDEKERLGLQLDALKAAEEKYNCQIAQATLDLTAAQEAVKEMDADRLLGILERLANAGRGARRDACEADLLEYLKRIGSVSQYQPLVALTADRRNVKDNGRPALLELKERLGQAAREREAALLSLQQLSAETQAELLPLEQKADIMEGILAGGTVCGVGAFDEHGLLTTAGRPLLLSSPLPAAGKTVAAGEPLAVFDALDTAEILANVEEQLIAGVSEGADAQVSPLYGKGVVWLGKVKSVSHRAVVSGGETVVPVTLASEKMTLGPGYNVVVKIFPKGK